EHYRRAIALQPKEAVYHRNLGLLLAKAGRPGEAEAAYRQSVAIGPKYLDGYASLADFLVHEKRPTEAEAVLRMAVEHSPNEALANNSLAWFLFQNGSDLREAEKVAGRATQLNPNESTIWHTLGIIQLKHIGWDVAITAVKRWIDSPDSASGSAQ